MKKQIGLIVTLSLTLAGIAFGQTGDKKLAVVNGETITEKQLQAEAAAQVANGELKVLTPA